MTWENFTREEFACTCGCGTNEIRDETIDVAQDIRTECGFPLPVTSGYRCPEHPAERNKKTATGTHPEGTATDFGVSHKQAVEVHKALAKHPRVTGIGINQRGKVKKRFIHYDIAEEIEGRPRPHIFSY